MRLSARSTSTRTFVLVPAAVLVEQALARRPVHVRWSPLLAWGYLQYRLCGRYRTIRGGGGPGMTRPPDQLVVTGPYAVTRNPMYLGHLVFLAGCSLASRSPVAAATTAVLCVWFDRRVRDDEARLRDLFGDRYDEYCRRTPRWLAAPRTPWTLANRTLDRHNGLTIKPSRDGGPR